MRANLQAMVVERLDVELVAAARAVRGIPVNRGSDAHPLAFLGQSVGVKIIDANADVVHRARIWQLVQTKESIAKTEVDPAVTWPTDHLGVEQRAVERCRLLDISHGKRGVIERSPMREERYARRRQRLR